MANAPRAKPGAIVVSKEPDRRIPDSIDASASRLSVRTMLMAHAVIDTD